MEEIIETKLQQRIFLRFEFHSMMFSDQSQRGLCPPAQGCRDAATLGKESRNHPTPTGLRLRSDRVSPPAQHRATERPIHPSLQTDPPP